MALGIASQFGQYLRILPERRVHQRPDRQEDERRRRERKNARADPTCRRPKGIRESAPALLRQRDALDQRPRPVRDEQHAGHVGVFFRHAGEREGNRGEREPARAVGFQERLEREDRPEREDQGIHVFPDEPGKVRQVRRDQDQGRVRRRRAGPDPAGERDRRRDQEQTEDRREKPGRRVRRSQHAVNESVGVIEEGSVVRRVVAPVAVLHQCVGLVRVNRFVVVERPVS